jgi:hypothetical protein
MIDEATADHIRQGIEVLKKHERNTLLHYFQKARDPGHRIEHKALLTLRSMHLLDITDRIPPEWVPAILERA